MGAYLATPNTEKNSHDETHDTLSFGVSEMQGWRMSMEDAHCYLTNFDGKDSNLFGVFDGHGGKEVAEYCAQNFYKFLLDTEAYQEGNLHKALKESFLAIDEALTSEEIIAELKELGGVPEEQNEEDEAAMLVEEAKMPIEELLERLKGNVKEKLRQSGSFQEDLDDEEETKQNGHLSDEDKVISGISNKSSKRKQSKPVKRTPGSEKKEEKEEPNSLEMSAAGISSSTNRDTSSDAVGAGSSSNGGFSASSECSFAGSSSDATASSSTTSSTGKCPEPGPSSLIDDLTTKDEDDPDYEADDPESDDDAEEGECDDDDGDDDDDDDGDSDSEDEFEDAAGVEFQPGNDEVGKDSGTTAIIALVHQNKLYVANVGDSRCVLCRSGKPIEMSFDHKPEDDKEKQRIEKAGGKITMDGRVNGGLNLSRAIGDHAYKQNKDIPPEEQAISACPDIKDIEITKDDDFMVLACDGIWNMMSSEEVVNFVKERLYSDVDEKPKLSKICEELFDHCLAPNTDNDGSGCDNMTCLIVRFKNKDLVESSCSAGMKRSNKKEASKRNSKKAKLSSMD